MGSTKGQNLKIGSTAGAFGSSKGAGKPERRQTLPSRGTTRCRPREHRFGSSRARPALSETTDQKNLHLLRRSSDDLPRRGSGSSEHRRAAQRTESGAACKLVAGRSGAHNGRAPARLRQPAADRQPPADGPQHAPGQPAADGPGQPPGHVQPAAEPRELRGPRGRRGAAAREPRVDGRLAALDAGQRRR